MAGLDKDQKEIIAELAIERSLLREKSGFAAGESCLLQWGFDSVERAERKLRRARWKDCVARSAVNPVERCPPSASLRCSCRAPVAPLRYEMSRPTPLPSRLLRFPVYLSVGARSHSSLPCEERWSVPPDCVAWSRCREAARARKTFGDDGRRSIRSLFRSRPRAERSRKSE